MNKKQHELLNHIKEQENDTVLQLLYYNFDTKFLILTEDNVLFCVGTGRQLVDILFDVILEREFDIIYVNNNNQVVISLKGVIL